MTLRAARPPFARLRGLDGIRAIAVTAVVAFHLGWDAVPGGFLGVEVFFVVSGYLITAILVHEWRGSGRIEIGRFWLRRARRLLPALFVTLLGTLAVASLAFPDEVTRLRTDALAAFAYVTNWYLLVGEQPYFETVGRPSALLHLWSLAIEEQFYLLWPLVLAGALAVRGRAAATAVAAAGIVASLSASLVLHVPGGDPSRVYYGTDTRAAGLLVGALLALWYVPQPRGVTTAAADGFDRVFAHARDHAIRRRALAHDLAAAAALAVLVAMFVLLDGTGTAFPAGLLLVDVATAVLIVTIVGSAGRYVPAALETAPLRWLGTRSYAVYLWHWPVIVFTRPGVDVALDGPLNVLVRLLAIGLLAEASYRWVERPIRDGALGPIRVPLGSGARRHAPRRFGLRAVGAASTAVAVTVLLVSVALAAPPPAPAEVPVAAVDGIVTAPPARPTSPDQSGRPSSPTRLATATLAPTARPVTTAHPSVEPLVPRRISAFGESVLIAAAPSVARAIGPFDLDAEIGRQAEEHLEIIRGRVADGTIGDVVILAIGNNGPIWSHQGEELMETLGDVPVVLWVNVSLAREWESHNNRLVNHFARRFDNVRVVDWHAASSGRRELFAKDMVHPNGVGAEEFAALLLDALASR